MYKINIHILVAVGKILDIMTDNLAAVGKILMTVMHGDKDGPTIGNNIF